MPLSIPLFYNHSHPPNDMLNNLIKIFIRKRKWLILSSGAKCFAEYSQNFPWFPSSFTKHPHTETVIQSDQKVNTLTETQLLFCHEPQILLMLVYCSFVNYHFPKRGAYVIKVQHCTVHIVTMIGLQSVIIYIIGDINNIGIIYRNNGSGNINTYSMPKINLSYKVH